MRDPPVGHVAANVLRFPLSALDKTFLKVCNAEAHLFRALTSIYAAIVIYECQKHFKNAKVTSEISFGA